MFSQRQQECRSSSCFDVSATTRSLWQKPLHNNEDRTHVSGKESSIQVRIEERELCPSYLAYYQNKDGLSF
jgi:hypothetical protein